MSKKSIRLMPQALIASILLALGAVFPLRAQEQDLSAAYQTLHHEAETLRLSGPTRQTPERLVTIVIYHTNDIHGHIGATPANPKTGDPASGGAASLATLLKGEGRTHLWIDSGDWFQGAAVGTLTRGDAVIDVFNTLGLTATVLGNHEYDYGEDNVERLARKAAFPILGANIFSTLSGSAPGYVTPYVIKNVAGIKIGIFGLLTHDMPHLVSQDLTPHLNFSSESRTAARLVQKLRREGATIVIAVTHLGIEEYEGRATEVTQGDLDLARRVPGIDIILGGHTHTKMSAPVTVTDSGYRTLIIQNQGMLLSADELDLSVDAATGYIARVNEHSIALDPSRYPPDSDTAKLVGRYQAQVDAEVDEPIGWSEVDLIRNPDGESAIGDWITDTYKAYGRTDIAMTNTHGIRADIPKGRLTKRNILEVMPFDDYLDKIEIKGSALRQLIQNNLGDVFGLQYSGLEIISDPRQPPGRRLVGVRINGRALEDDAIYTATTREYVLTVDKSFKDIPYKVIERLPMLVRDLLIRQVRQYSPLTARVEGRIQNDAPAASGGNQSERRIKQWN